MKEGSRSSVMAAKSDNGQVLEKDTVDSYLNKADGIINDCGNDKKGPDLVSIELDCVKEIKGESEHVECGEDADVDVDADTNADTARPKIGRGRRGRKRRRVESSDKLEDEVHLGIEKGDETNNTGGNDKEGRVPPECVEEKKMEGKRNGSENFEHIECNKGADVNGIGDYHVDMSKTGRGRRGRKRKMADSSVGNVDNGAQKKKVKEAPFDGKVGCRILRSMTVVMSGGEKMVDGGLAEGVVGGKVKKESDSSSKEIVEMEKDLVVRRGRGRPPKAQGKSGSLKVIGCEKHKEMGSRKPMVVRNIQKWGPGNRSPN